VSATETASSRARTADGRRSSTTTRDRGWVMRRMLLAADVLALSTCFLAVDYAYGSGKGPANAISLDGELLLFFLSLPAWVVLAKLYGLYDLDEERADHSTADELVGVFHLITVGAFMFYAGAWLTHVASPTPGKIITFWAIGVVLVTCVRAVARLLGRRHPGYIQRTIIVGAGDIGQLIARRILQHEKYKMEIIGFVDTSPKERHDGLGDLTILGALGDLPSIIESARIDRVIVAFSNERDAEVIDLIRALAAQSVCVDVVPRLFPLMGQSVGVHSIEGLPLVALPRVRLARSSLLLKRTLDAMLALLGLFLLSPVFALIAIMIKRDSPGPVFFKQVRMGSDERPFRMLKFRTMSLEAEDIREELLNLNKHRGVGGDARLFKVPDDPRVTRVGRFLRRYSMDELPQLINVLRGEMSLVGPRPLVLDEDRFVTDWRRRRLLVKPGMTGLWQVFSRDDLSFEEMIELDYRYIASWSLLSDVRLLLRTLPAVLRERSAY